MESPNLKYAASSDSVIECLLTYNAEYAKEMKSYFFVLQVLLS